MWTTLRYDTREFVEGCIYYLMSKTGLKIPRSIDEKFSTTKLNDVIIFDYLCMGRGTGDHRYMLVIKDELYSYVWLREAKVVDPAMAASEIASWIRNFRVMNVFASDQGSNLKNAVMELLGMNNNISHRFTIPY